MATLITTINNNAWTLILNGAGIIQIKPYGYIHIHIGTTPPIIDTEAYHSVSRSNSVDFSYSGTENVYCKNGTSADIAIVHTSI